MLVYTLNRLAVAIPLLFFVILITFVLVRLAPGGPFDEERSAPQSVIDNLNARYNLDKPIHVQFFSYLKHLLKGDFGPSFKYPHRSVTELIASGLATTLELGAYALGVSILFGIGIGLVSALKVNSLLDHSLMSSAMLGICLPSFVLGPLLLLFFGTYLQWVPVGGWGIQAYDKVLPTITLAASYVAYIARLTRGGMLDVLSQDYIRTAEALGISRLRIIFLHALRGGLAPVMAFLGPAAAGLLTGSFIVETVFQISGIGRFYLQAAFNRDYTMILGTTILFSVCIVIFNLLTDVISMYLNPRLQNRSLEKI